MIKRLFVLFCLFFSFSFFTYAYESVSVSASSAVLMVAETNEVIWAKNENQRRGIASTTKIMTALLTLECGTPQREIVATEQMVNVEGTSMGLLSGDKVTYHDLVYGMLLASGNDAANCAAISIGGSVEKFAELMNKRAKQIGMSNTNFVTPSGLDDENHYSTAYDMALLACCALRNNSFLEACSAQQAKLCYGNEPYTRYISNHNRLLKSYDGCIGVKTGFTKKSGRCLVSAARREGITLVCVTLNAPNDWNDHKKLLDYGFANVKTETIEAELPLLRIIGGSKEAVTLKLSENLNYNCFNQTLTPRIVLRRQEFAPLNSGDVVGEIQLLSKGKCVKNVPILCAESVTAITQEKTERSLAQKVKAFFQGLLKKGK